MTARRLDVTYGQLGAALRALGVTSRVTDVHGPARVYEHPEYGEILTLSDFPMSDRVYGHHLLGLRGLVDAFGIASPDEFDAAVEKVKQAGSRRSGLKNGAPAKTTRHKPPSSTTTP